MPDGYEFILDRPTTSVTWGDGESESTTATREDGDFEALTEDVLTHIRSFFSASPDKVKFRILVQSASQQRVDEAQAQLDALLAQIVQQQGEPLEIN